MILIINMKKEYSMGMFFMDTYINVKIYTEDKIKADNALNEVKNLYKRYHDMTDIYNEDSELSIINNNQSFENELPIDPDLYNMLALGIKWHDKTNGAFNINMSSVTKLWKKYRDNKNGVPTLQELKESGSIDINDIKLLPSNKIVNSKPNIDLGAISKGYATEKAGELLQSLGIDYFLINAGGNVLAGKNTKRGYYKIGIESPINELELYSTVKGENIAVVTSGGYKRYYDYDGIRYHHIINPDTLMPTSHILSVTIISDSSTLADILSTALFVLPLEDGIKLIDSIDNAEAIFFIDKDNIIKSKGYSKYE